MFSRKAVVIIGVLVLVIANIIILTVFDRSRTSSFLPYRIVLSLVAPLQNVVTQWVQFNQRIWRHYFYLVSAAQENVHLKQALAEAEKKINQQKELMLANERLRKLLAFKKSDTGEIVAAEVIGKDPSPWFKTIVINKGSIDGIKQGYPVVMAEGVVGQIIETSKKYAKVLLLIDQNSAVDAMIQRSRARGIIKGGNEEKCVFEYLLRKQEVIVGDIIITSGLDGVYPKGLSIGKVISMDRPHAGIFQHVVVTPFVDFEKLEEVVVMLPPVPSDLEHKP